MIDQTGIGVADVARPAAFCDAVLGALGLQRVMQLPANDGADGVEYRFSGLTAFSRTE